MRCTLAGLRLRVQRVALIGFNLRDFIKALQFCTANFHTIGLQNRNGRTRNFVRTKKFHTLLHCGK